MQLRRGGFSHSAKETGLDASAEKLQRQGQPRSSSKEQRPRSDAFGLLSPPHCSDPSTGGRVGRSALGRVITFGSGALGSDLRSAGRLLTSAAAVAFVARRLALRIRASMSLRAEARSLRAEARSLRAEARSRVKAPAFSRS